LAKPFAPATARWDNAQFAGAFTAKRTVLLETVSGLTAVNGRSVLVRSALLYRGALRQCIVIRICQSDMQFRRSDRALADRGPHPLDRSRRRSKALLPMVWLPRMA